ncbi:MULTISPECIES: signal peptide peptidase SppA [unclassified Campylobacter]|uniref:signal peptide peptidase SppA n=1 Tax=unclassified Campylobacter TaxID=2593542 RepID=UPI0022E9C406|nr:MULTISPECIES: signal peptide peptidase SppA [unclassified Campylobacter]MDA3055144.1 signal peptide peptidase SppA [Campylobacter sp. VBCF_07 NA4]MDA3061395.1 signal peptide peptidase SppA [Campylobacter sp. VBCF_02 NA5]MDA3070912.1 signal peptide peptidase SppA [Campylobacter sp. VBCF_08 NA3]
MQFLKNLFTPILAVLGFINKYFKSMIFLLIVFLIFSGDKSAQSPNANLATINLTGAIMDDSQILEKIKEIENNGAIKGVLLIIDSPGGALSPSVEISQAIKSLNAKKPVVAYAKGTMASGSYLSGVWASKIYANPGSFIGSIGVIMQGLDVSNLTEKIGISEQVVKAGEFKEAGTMMRPWSEAERESLQSLVNQSYELFAREVASARKLKFDEREVWANARVFLSAQAKKLGLIDEVGSLQSAKTACEKLSGVSNPIWLEPSPYEKMLNKLATQGSAMIYNLAGARLMAF